MPRTWQFCALSICLFVGLAESSVRILVPSLVSYEDLIQSISGEHSKYPATRSPYLPFTTPKNVILRHQTPNFDVNYHFNSLGYRGLYPTHIQKPYGVRRILICGDSFTLGWGSEEDATFENVMQRALDVQSGRFEVINAGYHDGYSTDSYYAYLEREGYQLDPDAVVIVIYTANDVEDIRDNRWTEIDARGGPLHITTSRTYAGYDGRYIKSPNELTPWQYKIPVLRMSRLFLGIGHLGSALSRALSFERSTSVVWTRFERTLRTIEASAKARGVRVLFVTIPARPSDEASVGMHRRIVRLLEGMPSSRLIDLKPVLTEDSYIPVDGHLNVKGNAITGRAILSALEL